MQTSKYETLFNIKTTGETLWSDDVNVYHPYQATDYLALDYLFENYSMDSCDSVVDFGCGKGRLLFYINYYFGIKTTGIEFDENYYKECLDNKISYLDKNKKKSNNINFECLFAQDYLIKDDDNKFYFFNPFSVEIFMKIINNIVESVCRYSRKIELIIYYPSVEYIYFLEYCTSFVLKRDISLCGLIDKDEQERFLIYEFSL